MITSSSAATPWPSTAVRASGDLDIWVRAEPRNAERLAKVFAEFGFGDSAALIAIFAEPGSMIQLGLPPNRIDVLSRISGVDFSDAWNGRVAGSLDGVSVALIGTEALLRNKRAAGRPKDLADVDEISKLLQG